MSSTPKAKFSNISELSVHPNDWDSHPSVERSTLTRCCFRNLSSGTKIDRSTLNGVTIMSERPFAEKTSADQDTSHIERSTIKDSEIHASYIERSEVKESRTTLAKIERSTLNLVKISSLPGQRQAYIERSQLASSEFCGSCSVSRCTAKDSVFEDVKMDRSTVNKSFITRAKLDRTTLEDCDVQNCELKGSSFKGKFIRNGKWDKGDLVGRLDATKEVVIRDMEVASEARSAPQPPGVYNDGSLPGTTNTPNAPRDLHLFIDQDPSPSRDTKAAYVQGDKDSLMSMDDYDGPTVQTPPPYHA